MKQNYMQPAIKELAAESEHLLEDSSIKEYGGKLGAPAQGDTQWSED